MNWQGIIQNLPSRLTYVCFYVYFENKLEQIERLHSEDTPCRLITHTIMSYWIQSQNKTKSKLQI